MYSGLGYIVCRYLISNFNMSCIKYQPFYTHAVYHTTVHSTYKLYIIVDAERNLWPLTHCGTHDGNKLYIYISHLSISYSYYVVRLHNIAILEGIITIIILKYSFVKTIVLYFWRYTHSIKINAVNKSCMTLGRKHFNTHYITVAVFETK